MPTLAANNNTSFGGDLINQKYAPLVGITVVAGDKDFIVGLFNQRITELSRQNLFPLKLTLITSALPAPFSADTHPMVVISSNRAEWLQKLFENAETKNSIDEITGYNDDTTFVNGA